MRTKLFVGAVAIVIAVAAWFALGVGTAEGGCAHGVVSQSCPPPPLDPTKIAPPAPPPSPDRLQSDGPQASVQPDGTVVVHPTTTLAPRP